MKVKYQSMKVFKLKIGRRRYTAVYAILAVIEDRTVPNGSGT